MWYDGGILRKTWVGCEGMVRAPQHVNGSSKCIYSGIKSPLLRNDVVKNNPRTHPLSLDPQDCIKQNKAHKNFDATQKPHNKKVTLHL